MSVTQNYKTITLTAEQAATLTFALERRIDGLHRNWRDAQKNSKVVNDDYFEREIASAQDLLDKVKA